jgi:drug/metabolite transporter (DMT)-like permease
MMRGAEMLFAALFAVLFLKRHLNRFHYMGIGCCAVSMAAALPAEAAVEEEVP